MRRGLDMRDCASQGEQRAALLALVLAEWDYQCGVAQKPLLLLDDVMSELDEARRRALVALVRRGGQTVITTTDLRYFSPEEFARGHGGGAHERMTSGMVGPADFDRLGDLLGEACGVPVSATVPVAVHLQALPRTPPACWRSSGRTL